MNSNSRKLGFTIIELLVVVSIIGLLLSLLIPAVGKARDGALTTQSLGNLRNLAGACGSYGADWNDRQPTFILDDFAQHIGGSFTAKAATQYESETGACPPSIIVGYGGQIGTCPQQGGGGGGGLKGGVAGPVYGIWGIWNVCEGGSAGGVTYATPMIMDSSWGGPAGEGGFKLANCRAFSQYVNSKYYDKVFFAPKDKYSLELAQPAFEKGDDFTNLCHIAGHGVDTTYCFSPSGMYAPEVFGSKKGCLSLKGAGLPPAVFRSPSSGQAAYPELKTRMLEHQWLQNREGPEFNPNWAGGNYPYYFNQCINSTPATLYYDSHVSLAGCNDSMDANAQVLAANTASGSSALEKGLFASATLTKSPGPWGGMGGYWTGPDDKPSGANFNYDTQVNTSFHIFTVDGILGRDFLVAK